uniref:Stabilin 1 n=1 Tax=Kryptolebias marmoratus TaxID=37003 RepID=A0A3Q3AZ81_KRYMA
RDLELQGCQHLCHVFCEFCKCKSFSCPQEGFSGFACHECKNPNAFGKQCDKVCDCVNGVCNKGPDGDGECLCQPPYVGKRCDQMSNRCKGCSPYSYCKGDEDSAVCECLPGYRTMLQNKCAKVCSTSDCDVNAQCSLKGSKVTCVCKPNYEGDGRICVPQNPCLENNGGCPINSTVCVFKGPNKSSCECMAGMSPLGGGPEFGCQLLSACTPDSCDPTAVCQTGLDGNPRSVFNPDEFLCLQLTVDDLAALPHIRTMANQLVSIAGEIQLGEKGVRMASTNIMASNGIIHMINGLLYPPSILPILPHRCDVTESKITVGPCVHCSFLRDTRCPEGSVEMVAECCKGFYGPDCKPCIGGFQHPCYDKGTCLDGIHGNGSCSCHSGFKGIACHICSDPTKHGDGCDEECHCMHGVCDNRPGSGGVCRRGSCLEGYSGENCERKATPCNADGLLKHCHVHAFCTQEGLDAKCVCRDGYEGDGHACAPVNLCLKSSRGGCDTNAECVYLGPGNVSCVCAESWTGDGKVCVEINNCQLEDRGGCSPNADCNHIGPGQSECLCKTGYMGNGKVCDLINPCYTNNGGCHELTFCLTLCFCLVRRRPVKESLRVQVVSLFRKTMMIRTVFSLPGVRAHFLVGIYSVEDLYGLVGSRLPTLNPSIQWEVRNISGIQIGNASIIDPNLPAINGYIHIINQVLTPPPSSLHEPPPLMVVLNSSSSFSLFRRYALVGSVADSLTSVCTECRFQPPSPLQSVVRDHNADVSALQDHTCCPGFYGHECFRCPGDVGSWCSNHGECQDGNFGNGECRCYEGFHGTACEDCEPGRYGVNCSSKCECGHGKCDEGMTGSGRCTCYRGWKGATCSVGEVKTRRINPCITGPQGSAAACVCVAGYEGNGTFCKELDLCSRSNGGCSEFAVCTKVSGGERTCSCNQGYTGDGVVCLEIDGCLVNNGGCHKAADCIRTGPNIVRNTAGLKSLNHLSYELSVCVQNNGGCSKHAACTYIGQGQRHCTCLRGYVGDGFDCRGSTNSVSHMTSDLPLLNSSLLTSSSLSLTIKVFCSNICSCFSPFALKLQKPPGFTRFSSLQGSVWINNASRIVKSDYTTSNGVIHHIDTLLTPYKLEDKPHTAATFYGYSRFYKLVEDAGLLPLLQMPIHQPITIFWPTDKALDSLPAERQRWLSSPDHQDQLAATIKAHIVRVENLVSENPIRRIGQPGKSMSYRTMHGSTIKLSCDPALGAVLINEDAARLLERFMSFKEGLAFGIDQLLEPPGLGAFCDTIENKTTYVTCSSTKFPVFCFYVTTGFMKLNPADQWREYPAELKIRNYTISYRISYGTSYSPWHNDLNDRFNRMGCKRVCQYPSWVQRCCKNHYSRDCQVCPGGVEDPCGSHGDCNDGITGSGVCRCHKGFTGKSCERCQQGYYGAKCTVCSCGMGRCDEGMDGTGQCVCKPGWEGDHCQDEIGEYLILKRFINLPAAPDLCAEYNGGCHLNADCNQMGLLVNCTCHSGYRGDGFTCEPINRCVEEQNGGCSDFAACKFTGPNERECECLPGYVGNGVQCLEKVAPPVDRCLEDNGDCDPVATCKDLHYHANTAGVFHLRSPEGKYQMNFSQADAACQAEDATLATFKQMGDAQQLGMHLCVAGWMDGGKVGYPTRFPSARCGDNHVGLVIYKEPVDQSSKYDAYCYRLSDVSCACPDGYVGDGDFCNGVLTSVLATHSNFSIFYKVSRGFPGSGSASPDGDDSQLLPRHHDTTSENARRPPPASVFNLPSCFLQSCKLVNQRLLLEWDIPAVNGIIHVLEAPLTAPAPPVSHRDDHLSDSWKLNLLSP